MWIELFLCLLLAHLVADFVLQTGKSCKSKADNKWRSPYQFLQAGEVFALSWLVTFDLRFWWGAVIIGVLLFFYRHLEVVSPDEGDLVFAGSSVSSAGDCGCGAVVGRKQRVANAVWVRSKVCGCGDCCACLLATSKYFY